MASLAAVLLSIRIVMSIGSSARDTRSTSRRAPFSVTTKASGPSPSTGPLRPMALTYQVCSFDPACAAVGTCAGRATHIAMASMGARSGWNQLEVRMRSPEERRRHLQYRAVSDRGSRLAVPVKPLKILDLARHGELFHKPGVYWSADLAGVV